jgi:hypothetical protein
MVEKEAARFCSATPKINRHALERRKTDVGERPWNCQKAVASAAVTLTRMDVLIGRQKEGQQQRQAWSGSG